MKLLQLILLSFSFPLFSMEPNKETRAKKIPFELHEEDMPMPDGQKLRILYEDGKLNVATFNKMRIARNVIIPLNPSVIDGLKNISVRGVALLPQNVMLLLLLGTANTPNDSIIFSTLQMPHIGGSSASYKRGIIGDKTKFIDFKVYGAVNEKAILVKAFSKVSKECKKYYFVLQQDETFKITNLIVATKDYIPQSKKS